MYNFQILEDEKQDWLKPSYIVKIFGYLKKNLF